MDKIRLKKLITDIVQDGEISKRSSATTAASIMELIYDYENQKSIKEEPVQDKGYQILAYKDSAGNVKSKYSKGYQIHPDATVWTSEKCEKAGDKIHTIKRLPDNEIFTIGDTVGTIYNTSIIKDLVIESIELDDKVSGGVALRGQGITTALLIAKQVEVEKDKPVVVLVHKNGKRATLNANNNYYTVQNEYHHIPVWLIESDSNWSPVQKEGKVLCVTEDGKSITDPKEELWLLYNDTPFNNIQNNILAENVRKMYMTTDSKWMSFSTLKARNEWLEYNKPCLSQKEVSEILTEVLHKQIAKDDYSTLGYKEAIKCALDVYVMDKLKKV